MPRARSNSFGSLNAGTGLASEKDVITLSQKGKPRMRPAFNKFLRWTPLCAAATLVCGTALAQQTQSGGMTAPSASSRSEGYSLLPYTRSGYVGINVGRSDYDDFSCGSGLFGCDDGGTRVNGYIGGLINDWAGVEVGALYEGDVDRYGGKTRAEGVNLSLVGRVPLGAFNVFGKVGATYGRTRISADALSGVQSGRARGWGNSFGVGAGYDITRNHGVVLEWSRNEFKLPGGDRRDIDGTSVGYVYRF
jgi:OmpA-OmpF porin, OOP family